LRRLTASDSHRGVSRTLGALSAHASPHMAWIGTAPSADCHNALHAIARRRITTAEGMAQ